MFNFHHVTHQRKFFNAKFLLNHVWLYMYVHSVCTYVRMCVYVYVGMYVCMYICYYGIKENYNFHWLHNASQRRYILIFILNTFVHSYIHIHTSANRKMTQPHKCVCTQWWVIILFKSSLTKRAKWCKQSRAHVISCNEASKFMQLLCHDFAVHLWQIVYHLK